MTRARKYIVIRRFEGIPKKEDFKIVEYDLPPLSDGEILVKSEWISVDPYMRAFTSHLQIPYDQFGYQVAVVQQSKHEDYPVGSRVVTHNGWCDYSILNVDNYVPFYTSPKMKGRDTICFFYKLPNLQGLSPSLGIGSVGMPGATAFLGFLEYCKPAAGETIVVTTAAGAVGSLVGQIAKIKGCKVIGFTGSKEKADWLERDLGFDKAFNYKSVNAEEVLRNAAPEGIDCYFDNVGGELSSTIINQMRPYGRVAVCGSSSVYNSDPSNLPKATVLQPAILFKHLTIQGVQVFQMGDRWPEAHAQLVEWIKGGQLKVREHITEGFDRLVDAFIGVLNGENIGKAVVKVWLY